MTPCFKGYKSLIDNSPDAITLVGAQGEIGYRSAAHTRLFGYLPDELVGSNYIDLFHPDDRDHSINLMNQTLKEPPVETKWDARMRRKDGTYRWVETTLSNLLTDVDVQAVVMCQKDIHERMEAQAKARQQAEELTRSNLRLEEFAYTVAHDLREPLRAITVFTQILFASAVQSEENRQLAHFVIEGTSRMSSMVTALLAFARSGMQAPPTTFRLQLAIEQARQSLALEIKESGAEIVIRSMPTVYSDEMQLVRVFQNLISNAVKYRDAKALTIEISAELCGPDWVIKVKDSGMGIPAAHLAKIFLPFTRLSNRDVPGTGLGLAVCKKAVVGLGGEMWVESKVGAGSTFTFTIPGSSETRDAEAFVSPAQLADEMRSCDHAWS
jgi:PAS domain S-box-containing protein